MNASLERGVTNRGIVGKRTDATGFAPTESVPGGRWQGWTHSGILARLSQRERLLTILAISLAIFWPWWLWFWQPLEARQMELLASKMAAERDLARLQATPFPPQTPPTGQSAAGQPIADAIRLGVRRTSMALTGLTVTLLAPTSAKEGSGGGGGSWYRLEIKLRGDYKNLLRFLMAPELAAMEVRWNRLDLQANHPNLPVIVLAATARALPLTPGTK